MASGDELSTGTSDNSWSCCGQKYDERAVVLEDHCRRCHRMFSQGWEACPYCRPGEA